MLIPTHDYASIIRNPSTLPNLTPSNPSNPSILFTIRHPITMSHDQLTVMQQDDGKPCWSWENKLFSIFSYERGRHHKPSALLYYQSPFIEDVHKQLPIIRKYHPNVCLWIHHQRWGAYPLY